MTDECTKRGVSLPPGVVLRLLAQVAEGLEAMHTAFPAVAHRDVKPHNVLVEGVRGFLEPRAEAQEGAAAGPREDAVRAVRASQARLARGVSGAEEKAQPRRRLALLVLEPGANSRSRETSQVLMDFGSARPAHIGVTNRREALVVQEDAAARHERRIGCHPCATPRCCLTCAAVLVSHCSDVTAQRDEYTSHFAMATALSAHANRGRARPRIERLSCGTFPASAPSICAPPTSGAAGAASRVCVQRIFVLRARLVSLTHLQHEAGVLVGAHRCGTTLGARRSLGCTLYAACFGMSPFEYSIGQAGGSIALSIMSGARGGAVRQLVSSPGRGAARFGARLVRWALQFINETTRFPVAGKVKWPKDMQYPSQFKELVRTAVSPCLTCACSSWITAARPLGSPQTYLREGSGCLRHIARALPPGANAAQGEPGRPTKRHDVSGFVQGGPHGTVRKWTAYGFGFFALLRRLRHAAQLLAGGCDQCASRRRLPAVQRRGGLLLVFWPVTPQLYCFPCCSHARPWEARQQEQVCVQVEAVGVPAREQTSPAIAVAAAAVSASGEAGAAGVTGDGALPPAGAAMSGDAAV